MSLEIGTNIVGGDVMRRRASAPAVHGFLDTLRDGHPTAPMLVVGPLLCPVHEDTPGPGAPDVTDGTVGFRALGDPAEVTDGPVGKLSLRAVRAELARIVAERLHPDAATHRIVGERFAAHVLGPAGPFA